MRLSLIHLRSSCTFLLSAVMFFGVSPSQNSLAAGAANAKSALAMNLYNINYAAAEQPFLNIFKTTGVTAGSNGGWWTNTDMQFDTGEAAYLQLDANGYPTTLKASAADPHSPQNFTSVGVLLKRELPNSNAGSGVSYRAGKYIVLYEGQGTLAYSMDAELISSSAGRDVINVAKPSGGGIFLRITSTDPKHNGNYIRNIRVVKAEDEKSLAAGNVFDPTYLGLLQNFKAIRFMQWLEIDDAAGKLTNWSGRPLPSDAGWGGPNGVPIEVAVQLCNTLAADCWLNVPHQANDDYVTQMAALVHATLATNQNVYIEFSNEVWNSVYPQYHYASDQGKRLWPGAAPDSNFNANWYGMRSAQTCDLWKSAWGADSGRVICVLAVQSVNFDAAAQALNCPLWADKGKPNCAKHGIDAVAVSVYLFVNASPSWLSSPDGGLSQVFEALNGSLKEVSNDQARFKAALGAFNLPLIAYEGGQSLVGFPQYQQGSKMLALFIAANRDARMQGVYSTMLNNWKTNGGSLFALYASIVGPGQYGEWGTLESLLDTVAPLSSAPPKWQAVQNFMSANACWWSGCAGTVGAPSGAVPMAPAVTLR